MTVGEKIKYYRELNGFSKRELGLRAGFSFSTAAVRISQYESEQTIPREEVLAKIATALNVDISALANINISNEAELLHTLFELENNYGVKITKNNDSYSITFENLIYKNRTLLSYLDAWYNRQQQLDLNLNTEKEYNLWRSNFPLEIRKNEANIEKKLAEKFGIQKEKLQNENFSISTLSDVAVILRYLFEKLNYYDICPQPQAPFTGKDSFVGILSFDNNELLSLNDEVSLVYTKFLLFVDYYNSFVDYYNSLNYSIVTKIHTIEDKTYTDFYIYGPVLLGLMHCVDVALNIDNENEANFYYDNLLKRFNVVIDKSRE